jgi:hypothetical protein
MKVCLGKKEARIETGQEPREAESKTGLEERRATDLEAKPEEIIAIQSIRNSLTKRPRWR